MDIKDKFINEGYLIIENLIDKNFNSFILNNVSSIIKVFRKDSRQAIK
jgi:hypothetical protein